MSTVASKNEKSDSLVRLKLVEEWLERRNLSFDALLRFLEKLGTTFDLGEIVRLYLMTLMGQLRLKRIALYMAVPGRRRFVACHSLGIGRRTVLPELEVSSSFVRWLEGAKSPMHLDGYFSLEGKGADGEIPLQELTKEAFMFTFPLVDQEQLVGILLMGGRITGEGFSDFEGDLLQMLSKVASISIKNAWLYQAAVLSKRELEKFSKVKREFINHTSHELRTPLTVLKSALWSVDPDGAAGGVLIDMAKDAVLRLESRVEHLLSLNDIELQDTPLRLQSTDVSSLLEDCLREVIAEVEEKHVTVRVNDAASFRKVTVDAPMMKTVFRCIIDNAINFVGQGGTITISTGISDVPPGDGEGVEIGGWDRLQEHPSYLPFGKAGPYGIVQEQCGDELEFSPVSANSYFVIRVKDDGIGIPTEEIGCLSEPFKRASNSTIMNVKGLGLGLSVSQKIICGHGGKLFCRSAPGEGAEFSIWLPVAR